MSFDARTLLIIGGFLCWLLAAAIEFQAVRPSARRVLPDLWTIGLLSKGLGLNLVSQRGLISDFWTIAIAQALILASLLFFYAALQKIRGVPANRMLMAAIPVGLAIVLPIIGFSQEAFQARVFAIVFAWFLGFLLACWAAIQVARAGYVAGASLILGTNAVLAVLTLAFVAAVATREVSGVFAGAGVQLAFYGIHDVCIAVSTFGYMDILRASHARQALLLSDPRQPDLLTGLFSSQTFSRLSAGELVRAERRGYPVCALTVSIDNLDGLRNSHGPEFSDEVLKRVAATLLREIRMYDVAGRLSGNLFGVFMPEMALKAGVEVAERIRSKVAADAANGKDELRIAISVGLCQAQGPGHDLGKLMDEAAECLERAQTQGGNRVVANTPPAAAGLVKSPA